MKTYFLALFAASIAPFLPIQAQENAVVLKQINAVKTNFRNLKDGESVNKTVVFKDGKINTIKSSDIVQSYFYNPNGLLDMTVKEREGSNWKEVTNYNYDNINRLIKLSKKYDENGEYVTKTVTFKYEGARIKAITKKSSTKQSFVEDNEYIVQDGLVVRRASRDRNEQIISKKEYNYYKGNLSSDKGLVGDKTIIYYSYDDKNSVKSLIASNTFGENFKVIVPLISFYEEEFEFQSISDHNELNSKATSTNYVGKSATFKYNSSNYPISQALIEENGIVKTNTTYLYE
jgi:ribosomal protein L35AE/L33A